MAGAVRRRAHSSNDMAMTKGYQGSEELFPSKPVPSRCRIERLDPTDDSHAYK
jgi:hypothetical protein